MFKYFNLSTMSSYARGFSRILNGRPTPMILHPNRQSDVFINKIKDFQRQNAAVKTRRESLFCLRPTIDNADFLNGPTFAAVKREKLKSISFLEQSTTNGIPFPTLLTTISDTHDVNPVLVGLNIGSGIKLIKQVDKCPAENNGNRQVVATGLPLSNSPTRLGFLQHWVLKCKSTMPFRWSQGTSTRRNYSSDSGISLEMLFKFKCIDLIITQRIRV